MEIETGFPLSRLTTIGTGGPAAALARPATLAELEEAVAWAADRGMDVVTIGLGSNVLAADEGVDALVVRLEGELASVSIDADLLAAGGGATNAVCLHRARAAGLGGLEFACAIPGTAGGGVRMNAGAYGSDWAAILRPRPRRVERGAAGGSTPTELGLSYRHSSLEPGQVVARVEYRLTPRPTEEIRADVADLVARRKATQPTNKRTFGSVFKNPPGERGRRPDDRALRSQGPPDRRRRDLPSARELHRERGRRNDRRLRRADGRGPAAGRRGVRRRAGAGGCVPGV